MRKPELIADDCRIAMWQFIEAGDKFHAIITDPPYDLVSVVQRFGKPDAAPAKHGTDGVYARSSRGMMGKEWDGTGIAFDPDTWALAYDCLLPGGYLLAFGGTRTWHRMACAIEDAGFEIRDTLCWLYGTGFPKSKDASKAIDKSAGAERAITGVLDPRGVYDGKQRSSRAINTKWRAAEGRDDVHDLSQKILSLPATPEAAQWNGWGTALKPSWEPIIMARKPIKGGVVDNLLEHRTGALNINACRIAGESTKRVSNAGTNGHGWGMGQSSHINGSDAGRWPANVCHDGSDEVEDAFAAFGDSTSVASNRGELPDIRGNRFHAADAHLAGSASIRGHSDSGSASRFFYSAKASKGERVGSKHPTIKPVALMRWLCTLVTPPNGRILDPFAGSGTTLQAAYECGFDSVGCEADPEYQADIKRRLSRLRNTLTDLLSVEDQHKIERIQQAFPEFDITVKKPRQRSVIELLSDE